MAAGVLVTVSTYLTAADYVLAYIVLHAPTTLKAATIVTAAVSFPPALLLGLAFGLVAHRLRKVVRVRCWKCGWREQYAAPRPGLCPSCDQNLRGLAGECCPSCGCPVRSAVPPIRRPAAAMVKSPVLEAGASPFDNLTDESEPWREAAAWAYAEVARGRTPEEVATDLRAGGWAAEMAEKIAEGARLETRHLRP